MRKAITIRKTIGLGDTVQFSSVPENYFRATGEMLIDIDQNWVFDFNPYVEREPRLTREEIIKKHNLLPENIVEMWSHKDPQPRPPDRQWVYLSLAERHCSVFNVPVVMKFPRLYRFENYPMELRETVLLHTHGQSHGAMPIHVIEHVKEKYKHMDLRHIGKPTDPDYGIPKIETPDYWSLAHVVSKARIFIGVDSGPSWIACCYPDIVVKKIKLRHSPEVLKNWIPLQIDNIHAHWDDRTFSVHNSTDDDIGFTSSYRRI